MDAHIIADPFRHDIQKRCDLSAADLRPSIMKWSCIALISRRAAGSSAMQRRVAGAAEAFYVWPQKGINQSIAICMMITGRRKADDITGKAKEIT
jgi:hypothetical protein